MVNRSKAITLRQRNLSVRHKTHFSLRCQRKLFVHLHSKFCAQQAPSTSARFPDFIQFFNVGFFFFLILPFCEIFICLMGEYCALATVACAAVSFRQFFRLSRNFRAILNVKKLRAGELNSAMSADDTMKSRQSKRRDYEFDTETCSLRRTLSTSRNFPFDVADMGDHSR